MHLGYGGAFLHVSLAEVFGRLRGELFGTSEMIQSIPSAPVVSLFATGVIPRMFAWRTSSVEAAGKYAEARPAGDRVAVTSTGPVAVAGRRSARGLHDCCPSLPSWR